jgi:hypothetical protein
MRPYSALLPLLLLLPLTTGCGLTVTNERPTFEELDPVEQTAVRTVLRELRRFNAQVKRRTPHDIDRVVDQESIHVSFEGLIFSGNLGDGTIHVAVWENLGPAHQQLVGQWFKASPARAGTIYRKFFYQFMAVVQGVKQFMYELHTAYWIFTHRSLWNIERDSIRTALSHYVAEGRQGEMWSFLAQACVPIKAQYGELYRAKFTKSYLKEHFTEIFNPDDPSGYMYFICRWIDHGKGTMEGLSGELDWLVNLPD